VTDTGQSFTSKAVGSNGSKILKLFKFGGSESLTENRKIISLKIVSDICSSGNLEEVDSFIKGKNIHRFHDRCQ
jgi:hypothetical protein